MADQERGMFGNEKTKAAGDTHRNILHRDTERLRQEERERERERERGWSSGWNDLIHSA